MALSDGISIIRTGDIYKPHLNPYETASQAHQIEQESSSVDRTLEWVVKLLEEMGKSIELREDYEYTHQNGNTK